MCTQKKSLVVSCAFVGSLVLASYILLFIFSSSSSLHSQFFLNKKKIFFFSDSSYGSVRASLVSENLSNDKELSSSGGVLKTTAEKQDKDNSSLVKSSAIRAVRFEEVSTSPPSHVILKHRVVSSESEEIYSPVDSNYTNQNYYPDYQTVSADDISNWPYDLSRSSVNNSRDYSTPPTLISFGESSNNYRNIHYTPYIASNMKGNLMTLSQFNTEQFLSPPSSVSSSSGYEFSADSNNNSFITNIDQMLPFHHIEFDAEFRDDEFKNDNCFLVEDINTGSYTTLTTAAPTNTPADLFHLHQTDYQRSYFNNHSTSSGGESRSPDEYNNDDYEHNGIHAYADLTQLTTRPTGLYQSSPRNDHSIVYETSSVLSPTR